MRRFARHAACHATSASRSATVLYRWPSVSRTIDYRIDERNNEWTIAHLRWFLRICGASRVRG